MKKNIIFLTAALLFGQIVIAQDGDITGSLNLPDCARNGARLFAEDFGGNDPAAPPDQPNAGQLANIVAPSYTYKVDLNNSGYPNGVYCLTKYNFKAHDTWYQFDDHTYPNDISRGYFFACDAASSGTFYRCTIPNLCPGTRLLFSVWLGSLINGVSLHEDKAKLRFIVNDMNGQRLITIATENLPDAQGTVWRNYSFNFFTSDQEKVEFIIENASTGTSGNDFVMDDIEVYHCTPPVEIEDFDISICHGEDISVNATFYNNGDFSEPKEYMWLHSATGNIDRPQDWTTVGLRGSTTGSSIPLSIPSSTAENKGYYRLAIAGNGALDYENCRVMSNPLHINVKDSADLSMVDVSEICAGDDHFEVSFQFEGTATSTDYTIDFDTRTRIESINGTLTPSDSKITVDLPSNIKAGEYYMTFKFDDNASLCTGPEFKVPFVVKAPIIEQNWDDVIAVLKPTGITYTSFKWFKNGKVMEGETGSYIYITEKLNLGDNYCVEITTSEGNTFTSCTLTPQPYEERVDAKPIVRNENGAFIIIAQTGGTVNVYNIYGHFILRENIENQIILVFPGIYVFEIMLNNGTRTIEKVAVR